MLGEELRRAPRFYRHPDDKGEMSGNGGSGVPPPQERVKLLVVRSVLKRGAVGPRRVMNDSG